MSILRCQGFLEALALLNGVAIRWPEVAFERGDERFLLRFFYRH